MSFGFMVWYSDLHGWNVSLPHSCDDWTIVEAFNTPNNKDEAVRILEEFIAEANTALAHLREGKAFGRNQYE